MNIAGRIHLFGDDPSGLVVGIWFWGPPTPALLPWLWEFEVEVDVFGGSFVHVYVEKVGAIGFEGVRDKFHGAGANVSEGKLDAVFTVYFTDEDICFFAVFEVGEFFVADVGDGLPLEGVFVDIAVGVL